MYFYFQKVVLQNKYKKSKILLEIEVKETCKSSNYSSVCLQARIFSKEPCFQTCLGHLISSKIVYADYVIEFMSVNGKPSQSPPVPCHSSVASPGHNKTMSTTSGTYKINLLSGTQERPWTVNSFKSSKVSSVSLRAAVIYKSRSRAAIWIVSGPVSVLRNVNSMYTICRSMEQLTVAA